MKRVLPFAVLAVLVTGCNQTDANKEHAETTEQFDQAAALQERAHSGTVDNVKLTAYGKTQEEYRYQKLGESTTLLRELATRGEAKQQVAVRELLSEAEKSAALASVRAASVASARQAALSTELLSLSSDVRLARADAEAHAGVDLSPQLAEANAAMAEMQKEKDQLTTDAAALKDKVSKLESQIADLDKQRTDKSKEAEKLSRDAFAAKGQQSFDLYARAGELTKAADQLTAQRETLDSQRDAGQSALNVLNARVEHLTGEGGRIPGLQAAITELQDRANKEKELASTSKARAEEAMAAFDKGFASFTATQSEKINAAFVAAGEQLNKAIEEAKAAVGRATSSTRDTVQLEQAAREALLGFALYRQMLVDSAYRDMLTGLATALQSVDADKAKSITDAATAAGDRVKATTETATETFNTAIESLDKVAAAAKTAKNEKLEASAIELQIASLRGLAAVAGDDTKASRVTELKARRAELTTD